MAIRRPSVYDQSKLIFQDFLELEVNENEQIRSLLIKYDGEGFTLVKQTFDYNPPEFKGGPIIGRIDYTLTGNLVTIDSWEANWRDEWPLRLGVQYLVNCLYKQEFGYIVRVLKDPYPFWVSEYFFPVSNDTNDYLIRNF